jgi:hypothetical protein
MLKDENIKEKVVYLSVNISLDEYIKDLDISDK